MNNTSKIILFAIFTFILINQLVLHFGIQNNDYNSEIVIVHNGAATVDTLQFKGPNQLINPSTGKNAGETIKVLFHQNPSFLLYVFFLTFFSATSLSLIIPLHVRTNKNLPILKEHSKKAKWYFLLSLVITTCIFLMCNMIPNAWSPQGILGDLDILFKKPLLIMLSLLAPILVLGATCIYGIFGISMAIQSEDFSVMNKEEAIKKLLHYKKTLNEYIVIFGLFIATCSIIVSSLLADSVNAIFVDNSLIELVPKEFVYLYGLTFTAGIIIIYVPVHLKLRKVGEELISKLNPMGYEPLETWNQKNNTYMEALGIKKDVWEGVKTSLTILSPIITSIIATLI